MPTNAYAPGARWDLPELIVCNDVLYVQREVEKVAAQSCV